jgi:DNA-3-methyladenine glycosylase II
LGFFNSKRRDKTLIFTQSFTVHALSPFDFDLSAQIFRNGDPQIRRYENGTFHQVIRLNGKLVLVELTSLGTVEKPELCVKLKSNSSITPKEIQKVKEIINYIFNLNFNLQNFYIESEADSVMHQLAKLLYGLKNPTTPTVFESLVDSIVEQQISIKVAQIIEVKIAKKFGETLTLDDEAFYAYPTAQSIAQASVDEIRGCGLSQRKAEYINGAAKLIAEFKLDLEKLKNNTDATQIINELDEIRGIGVWTAELTMLRGMQKLDALPGDDLGIRRVISRYYSGGKPIKMAEARKIAEGWGRWKGLAAYYLIVAEIRNIQLSI